jgi:DNA-directed RNA polymerase specialized sigma24 family protein
VGPGRTLSHGARRQIAVILRNDRSGERVVETLLDAYGPALHDFIMLMVGPSDMADQVLADTVTAATHLAPRLQDDDLLTAWVFALARKLCRRHPPVVWREPEWRGLRDSSPQLRAARPASVPVAVIRMALLGIAPRDREFLLLSSTYCKLMSSDLAAVFGMSTDGAASAVADAHQRFEQALAMSATEVGYQREPGSRAPEIGELVGAALHGVTRPIPDDRVFHMALAPQAAGYRRELLSGMELAEHDGFPVLRAPRQLVGHPRPVEPGRHMGAGHHPRSPGVTSRRPPLPLRSAG